MVFTRIDAFIWLCLIFSLSSQKWVDITGPNGIMIENGTMYVASYPADKKTMYITNWTPAEVSTIDMNTKKITPIKIDDKLIGAADITVVGDTMYIPDLPNSRVIVKKL